MIKSFKKRGCLRKIGKNSLEEVTFELTPK